MEKALLKASKAKLIDIQSMKFLIFNNTICVPGMTKSNGEVNGDGICKHLGRISLKFEVLFTVLRKKLST